MKTRKYDKRIITHTCGPEQEWTFSNGFVLSGGTYRRDIAFYKDLAKEAKKDFPHLKNTDIECFVVTKSGYNKGSAGVRFPLPEKTTHPEYFNSSRLDFDHS